MKLRRQRSGGYIEWPEVILFGLMAICVLLFAAGLVGYFQAGPQIKAMGYDLADVDTFLNGTNWYRSDFVESEGVRKQYERFRTGQLYSAPADNTSDAIVAGAVAGSIAASAGRSR